MPIDFSDIVGGTGAPTPGVGPTPVSAGGLDFSDIVGGGFATPQTPAQISGARPQIANLGQAEQVIGGGIQEAAPRTVAGQTLELPENAGILKKSVTGVGNFLFQSAPDILAREANKGFAQQTKNEIMSSAQGQIDLHKRLIDAEDDPAKKERMLLRLANYIQETNDLLGDDVFQAPTGLQLAGAVGTVAANVIPAFKGGQLIAGRKIGTKLGEDILGNVVGRGVIRQPMSLLEKTGALAVEGGLFGGSEAAARTGDIGETLKGTAIGGAIGGAIPGAGRLAGKALSPIARGLENPMAVQNESLRWVARQFSPVANVIKSAGATGAKYVQKLDEVRIERDLFRANAKSNLENFKNIYKTLTSEEKDLFYNITAQNTTANPALKGRILTTEELLAKTDNQRVREAITVAEPVTKEISEAQKGRAFKGGKPQAISKETGGLLPSEKNIAKLDEDVQNIGREALKYNNPEQLISRMDEIQGKVKISGLESLTPEEKLLYEVDQTLGLQTVSREDALKNIFNHAKKGTIGETKGGILFKKPIQREAEVTGVFFPTSYTEQIEKGQLPDVEERIRQILQTDKEIKAIPDEALRLTRARNKAEAELEKYKGPRAGKAKEIPPVTAEEARKLGYETDAIKAYDRYIERESDVAAQFKIFGEENLTGKADASVDEIVKAFREKTEGQIRKELETKFGQKESKDVIEFITKNVNTFLGDQDFNQLASNLKKFQSLKLGLSFLPNLFQTLNTALASDLPSLVKGIGRALTPLGQEFAEKAGAKEGAFITGEVGTVRKFLDRYLKLFKFTEQNINRAVSANTAASMAEALVKEVNKTGTGKAAVALERLEELVGKQFERGKLVELTEKDLLRAANRFTKLTQFGYNPLDLPGFASTPLGSVFFQFKSFAYNQLKFVFNQTVGELQSGNPGRAARNFAILATLFPLAGEGLNAVRNFITGRETDADIISISRYLDNIAAVGGMGIIYDLTRSATSTPGKLIEYLAGPTISTGADVATTLIKDVVPELLSGEVDVPLESLYKLSTKQLGGLGAGIRNITEQF